MTHILWFTTVKWHLTKRTSRMETINLTHVENQQRTQSFITLIAFGSLGKQQGESRIRDERADSFWQRQKTSSACKSARRAIADCHGNFVCSKPSLFIAINLFSFYFHAICCEHCVCVHGGRKLRHTFLSSSITSFCIIMFHGMSFVCKKERNMICDINEWRKCLSKFFLHDRYDNREFSRRSQECHEFFNFHSFGKNHSIFARSLRRSIKKSLLMFRFCEMMTRPPSVLCESVWRWIISNNSGLFENMWNYENLLY